MSLCSKPRYWLKKDFFINKPKLNLWKIPTNHDRIVKSYSIRPKNFLSGNNFCSRTDRANYYSKSLLLSLFTPGVSKTLTNSYALYESPDFNLVRLFCLSVYLCPNLLESLTSSCQLFISLIFYFVN